MLPITHHLGPWCIVVRGHDDVVNDAVNDAIDDAVDDANGSLVILRVVHDTAAHPNAITVHCPAKSPQTPWTAVLCRSRIIMH